MMNVHTCQFCGDVFDPTDYQDRQCPCDRSQSYAHDGYDGSENYEEWAEHLIALQQQRVARTGRCAFCGEPATCNIPTGWDAGLNRPASQPACAACYAAEMEELAARRAAGQNC